MGCTFIPRFAGPLRWLSHCVCQSLFYFIFTRVAQIHGVLYHHHEIASVLVSAHNQNDGAVIAKQRFAVLTTNECVIHYLVAAIARVGVLFSHFHQPGCGGTFCTCAGVC